MLPDELQDIYSGYGPAFREGYVALHQGEFQKAAECLDQALQSRPENGGYIMLELAGAYFNLGRNDEARHLTEEFTRQHPDALPGYELLCEIYWEQEDFGNARQLLENCPKPLHATVAYVVLYGETLRRETEYSRASDWFNEHLQRHGWNDKIALALASVYEQNGEADQALDLYSRYIGNCRGCGSTTPPEIERRYADLSLAGGNISDEILELYLSLARKDPTHAADCYHKVSRIYTDRGNQTEALRFEAIAEQVKEEG
jgi:tetratricopeptide (TPR) repeat protein